MREERRKKKKNSLDDEAARRRESEKGTHRAKMCFFRYLMRSIPTCRSRQPAMTRGT